MKKLIFILSLLLAGSAVNAASTNTVVVSTEGTQVQETDGKLKTGDDVIEQIQIQPYEIPVEQKVVEIHITRITPDTKEAKQRAKQRMGLEKQVDEHHYVCSGAFVTPKGFIITARHCQEDASELEVVTFDQQHYRAEIVAVSPLQDLALLHIDRVNTPYFTIASSVTRGEEISTLGSPLALTNTQSWGRVARIDGDILLMDESVLPGNSGGVVFNKNEELVGVAVSVSIVGMGVTHLSQCQSRDSVLFFLSRYFSGK